MEYLLESEVLELGLEITKVAPRGVYGNADLATLYSICLWSRLANRVQLVLFSGCIESGEDLHELCSIYPWNHIFSADKSIAVDFYGQTPFINNTMYGAQLIKDAVVDYFKAFGDRPNVDRQDPNIRLHAHVRNKTLTVSLDFVGYSLHQRGYRQQAGSAPLKENIAAAILIRSKWPQLCSQGYDLVDPCCGSATILIEGALMAANIAPGLFRDDQSFKYWADHDESLWRQTIDDARSKQRPIKSSIYGFDINAGVLQAATSNIIDAGFNGLISVKPCSLQDASLSSNVGLLVCNPPYGERISEEKDLIKLYEGLGLLLYQSCQGWVASVLTSSSVLADAIGLRKDKKYSLYNGPIETTLYCFNMDATNSLKSKVMSLSSDQDSALYNRLKKNNKNIKKWAAREGVSCYRLYDADLPEYAFAIDVYNDWVHVQEYAAPKEIPLQKAARRRDDLLRMLPEVLGINKNHVVLKQRKKQRGKDQYRVLAKTNNTLVVQEGGAKLKVNLHDYLDTGLFLDHRPLRKSFFNIGKNKKVLNCFCYTAAFSVHAALGGAKSCNVDLSNTYLAWAQDNFALNNLSLSGHRFVRADCMQWLKLCQEKFDVIFLDPPSFSNSKSMDDVLDVQRDHEQLVDMAMCLLAADGVLYFSNNLSSFKLSSVLFERYQVKDITHQTIDYDFKRKKMPHVCYKICF